MNINNEANHETAKKTKFFDLRQKFGSVEATWAHERAEVQAKIDEGIAAAMEDIVPIYEVGSKVRLRKIENAASGGILAKECIQAGNLAAHHGSVLADAILFTQHPGLDSDVKTSWFRMYYGFGPSVVLQLRNCKPFLQALDWRGGVMESKGSCDFRNKFHEAFDRACLRSPLAAHWADRTKEDGVDVEAITMYFEHNETAVAAI